MKASIKNIEQTIASEQYRPALSEEYQELFQRLTRRLEDTLPMNRARIISVSFGVFLKLHEKPTLTAKNIWRP